MSHHLDFVRFRLQMIGARRVDTVSVEHTWDEHRSETPARGIADADLDREFAG